MMASFLSRSFRRTLHEQQEGKIIKSISAGQNLEVSFQFKSCLSPRSPCSSIYSFFYLFSDSDSDSDLRSALQVKYRTWDILREEGAIIEEEKEDDDDNDESEEEDGGPQSFDEKQMLAEQVAMHLVPGLDGTVVKTAQRTTSRGMDAEDLR